MQTLRLRTVFDLSRAEGFLLVRGAAVLAGLVAAGILMWLSIHSVEPLWWEAAWKIGFGQLVLGMAVLVAGQLAAGRARRDNMADLYASFPATASTRTLGLLAGLAGAVPAGLLLIGATVVAATLFGAVGAPSITVLAGGLLLVIACGAVGVAIGTRFAHPMAGVLGALALFASSSTTHIGSGAGIWLLPWEGLQDQLSSLPGPLAGYPPAGAHVLELAGIAILAGVIALAVTDRRVRARAWLATAGIVAVAMICFAGALQLRPIPTADLNRLVSESANPASVQHCTTAERVSYCLYPGFGSLLPSLETPVSAVLARVPALPGQPLTIRQVVSLLNYTSANLIDPSLTHGHPQGQVSRWQAELQRASAIASRSPGIYLPVGGWPAFGNSVTDAQFNVALAAADWSVHMRLATTTGQPCVAFDQAREAIAIWLAIVAAHPRPGELQAGLPGRFTSAVFLNNTFVPLWIYPGQNAGQIAVSGSGPPQITEAGYLLAHEMTGLTEAKVARVLKAGWGTWINPHTTDAQLAAALGIAMPSVHVPPASASHQGTPPPSDQSQECS